MDMDTAKEILEQIEGAARGNKTLEELRLDLMWAAVRYARTRAEWTLLDRPERGRRDPARTLEHNTLIDACNILERAMGAAGADASWRERIGNDRKTIGDFGCYVAAILGIRAR